MLAQASYKCVEGVHPVGKNLQEVKSLHFNLGITNTGLEVRCKSLHFNLGIADANKDVGCKNVVNKH